jgi:hypothetical protein
MLGRVKIRVLVIAVALFLLAPPDRSVAADEPTPSPHAARSCDTRNFVIYAFGGVTCREARRGVRWMRRHRRGYPGYRCSSGSGYRSGAYCKRGRRVFGFHPYD